MKCDCVQEPPLRQTGRSSPDAEWICPICKKEYYVKDGGLTKEKLPESIYRRPNVMGNSGGK